MTLDPNRKSELDQVWIDSLLKETLQQDPHKEADRLKALFSKPDFIGKKLRSPKNSKILTQCRWIPLALAATLMFAASIWFLLSSNDNRAYAAVARSLKPTPRTREYSIQILANAVTGKAVTRSARLFLQDDNRFAVHSTGWLGFGDNWFGSDGKTQWVVPRFGPAFCGNERLLGNWLVKKDATAPYLHINTILKRLEKGYALSMLPDTTLVGVGDQRSVYCEHVLGEWNGRVPRKSKGNLPVRVELWADKETGIAHRVVLNWNRDQNEVGPVEWTFQFVKFDSLENDWFEANRHLQTGQRIISVGSDADLEDLSKDSAE